MGKLSDIARNILGNGGEYISLDSLIANYPEGITINGSFVSHMQGGRDVPCFTFAEDPTKYFWAVSGDLKSLYENWLSSCDGDIDELNESLRYENIRLKIWKKKIKGGKTYTKAQPLGFVEKAREEIEEPAGEIDFETGELISEKASFTDYETGEEIAAKAPF